MSEEKSVTGCSNKIGYLILQLLGIESNLCTKATIHLVADKQVHIEAEMIAEMDLSPDTTDLKKELKKYKLTPIKEEEKV